MSLPVPMTGPEVPERSRGRSATKCSPSVITSALPYWASFAEYLKQAGSNFRITRPNKDHWKWFSIGRSGFGLSVTISTEKDRAGVELYITNDVDKVAFNGLQAQKVEIEKEFGEPLDWQELPGRKASRIALFKYNADPSDKSQYP